MRELFNLDKKDYKGTEKVFSRPSARAIIEREGKLLMIHSPKYDYYKFPGGGIEKGEDVIAAMCREVREETGYLVVPESVTEYGYVLRKHLSLYQEDEIFEQYNYYYLCEVQDVPGERKLDDYEAEEGYEVIWIEPFRAERANRYSTVPADDAEMVKREEKVLAMFDMERRELERKKQEKKTLAAMSAKTDGKIPYDEMLDFVYSKLVNGESECVEEAKQKIEINYSRFEHTKRVLGWALRLYEAASDKENIRFEDVMIATIFHDVGRLAAQQCNPPIPHSKAGEPITGEYLTKHGFSKERVDYICYLVSMHSDKQLMTEPDIDRGLLLLMEADLLDDMGALGIVMDCMIVRARNPKATFADSLDHIMRYTHRIQAENPLVTPEGRRMWEDKTTLVNEFARQLEMDVTMGE